MLKRILILFLIVLFLCSNVFAISRNQENVQNLEKTKYYIDISKEAINTNNINQIFKNMKILKLYPLVNLKIEDKRVFSKVFKINFIDVNTYIENYVSCLNDLGFYDDAERVVVSGIKINVIFVEANKMQIDNLLVSFPKAKVLKKANDFVFNFD